MIAFGVSLPPEFSQPNRPGCLTTLGSFALGYIPLVPTIRTGYVEGFDSLATAITFTFEVLSFLPLLNGLEAIPVYALIRIIPAFLNVLND